MDEMKGRAVIVTGGASGIGRATALLLAREGARVFIGDIDEAGGQAAAAAANGAAEFAKLDLADTGSIEAFAAAVHGKAGRVDGLVNGAGWDRIQPFIENPPEMWESLIEINLMGAIRLTRAVLPPMIEAQAGKIVNISSDAGRVGSMGETVYAAARVGSSPLPSRWRARWRGTSSTSIASAPARPTRRSSAASPSGCRKR